MKILHLLSFSLLLAAAVPAQDPTPRYQVPEAARRTLIELRAEVEHGRAENGDYLVELSAEQVALLQGRGFAVRQIAPAPPPDAAAWTSYGTMRANFLAHAATYPGLAQFHVIGTSVQGREIFGLRISDNVAVEEDEPEVAFWASIHGDEFASGEIAHDWALELLDAYGVDPVKTAYVDDHEIWVFPLLNPDGHELSRRTNANNVDLNRDCSWQWDGAGNSPAPTSQPETRAWFDFCKANNITLSVTMHCSGNVFLYPWCATPTAAAEDALIRQVGALYSGPAGYQLKNSWADYETHGEVIDVMYGAFGSLCYTAEISNSQSLYADSYSRNSAGMNAFCAAAGQGLHGVVTDAQTGQPLRAAVYVSGSPHPAYTDPAVGDVHRMALPGTYDVTVVANGYRSATVAGLVVAPGGTTDFQVALVPGGGNEHAFFVQAVNQRDPTNSYANKTIPNRALGAPDGLACSLGRGGMIVLDLGAGHAITDGPGVDFTVTEALTPEDGTPERYAVFAGGPYDQPTFVGIAIGTASFDLGAAGVSATRYLRIVDDSGAPSTAPFAGVELDAVTVLNGAGPRSLAGDVSEISLATGGAQTLSLQGPDAGAAYVILGTVTGTSPGTPLPGGLTLPLNPDGYFWSTVGSPNTLVLPSVGVLDAAGQATATFALPPLSPALAGVVFEHAYLLIDVPSLTATFVSNAVAVTLR